MTRNIIVILLVAGSLFLASCEKDKRSETFKMLTSPTWVTDSLLANGLDASAPGGLLYRFKGDAKFNEDGSGTFGKFTGKWVFNADETQITITTDSLPLPINSKIRELTSSSLKITAVVPNMQNLTQYFNIRMTFKAK